MQAVTTERTGEVCLDEGTRRAKRIFEEIWSNPVAAKQNWQRIAFLEAVIILCAVCWLGYLGQLPKQVLYVVDRDKAGNIAYAGPAKPVDMNAKTWDLVKVQALRAFLESWRTVTTDRTAQANDWDRAFLFVGDGSQAKGALNSWFERNDPIKRANSGELSACISRRSTWPAPTPLEFGGKRRPPLWPGRLRPRRPGVPALLTTCIFPAPKRLGKKTVWAY